MVTDKGIELIIGSSTDRQFGPVVLFGAGGVLVEVLQDRALGLPPLNRTLARRLMERTRIYPALQGVRGQKPVDLEGLETMLARFSLLLADFVEDIQEVDMNPVLASPGPGRRPGRPRAADAAPTARPIASVAPTAGGPAAVSRTSTRPPSGCATGPRSRCGPSAPRTSR